MRPTSSTRALRCAIAVAAAVACAAVFVVAAWTDHGRRAEAAVLDASAFATDSALLALVSAASLAVACIVLGVVGLLRRRGDLAVVAVLVVAASAGAGQVLKHVVLTRPDLAGEGANTFPSGHMTAFAAVAAAALVVSPPRSRLALAPAAAVVLSIAAARLVHDGWHRPSDVVGSLLLVMTMAAAGMAWRAPQPVSRPGSHRLVETLLVVVACITGASGAGIALVTARGPGASAEDVLLATTFGLVAVVLAWVAATSWLVRLRPRRGGRARAHPPRLAR
jgi:hypothetical protein